MNRIASTSYDLLVVGGGILGLACAYEAASRGLSVALIDAGDFGSGTTFNHQKTVHGGLRALQTLAIGRARASIRERRALARIAPWLLRPLPFLTWTYRSMTRGRAALRAAFALDGWLGRQRNAGVEPELHLPRARLLSKTATLKLFPGIRAEGLTGGAQWYDYQMVENDRLTFAVAAAADRAGADLATYVEAREIVRRDGRVGGIRAQDVLTGQDFEVRARVIVNAAGARAADVMRMIGITRPFPLLKAMNLVTSKPAADIALAAPDPRGRMLTLVPWRGKAIVGTGQSSSLASGDAEVTAEDVERFIGDANHAFPALKLGVGDVTLVHRGLVPAVTGRDGSADLLQNPRILDHAPDGADGVFTVIAAKYTTARATAERLTNTIGRQLRKPLGASRTSTTVLPFAGIADHEALAIETGRRIGVELELPLLRHLMGRYAEGAAAIVKLIGERPDSSAALAPSTPTIAAEVLYVIRSEGALRLSDIVLRRTTLGAAGHPGAAALRTAAGLAATELGWDAARTGAEIAAVEQMYRVPQGATVTAQ
jgi:glycerol-3-phosphate dehydrogenase